MSVGICGKNCGFETCELREELNCPGCRMGPGNEMYGDCPIAACSRARKTDGCDVCPARPGCTENATKELIPHRRKTGYAAKVAREAVMSRRAPYMKRLLWMLFWFTILRAVGFSTIFEEGTRMYRGFLCLEDALGIAGAMVLIGLAREERGYRIPGYILAVRSVHDFLFHLLSSGGVGPGWELLNALFMPFVEIVFLYFLLTAHAALAPDVDVSLVGKWLKLRKWYLICLIGIQVCSYAYVIFPILFTIAVVVFAVMYIVVSILDLVYLYRMAKGYSFVCSQLKIHNRVD